MGDGKLGLLIALVLHWSQARVVLAGKHEKKLAIARDQGVPTMALKELVVKKVFDIVVEATGSPEGLRDSLSLCEATGGNCTQDYCGRGKKHEPCAYCC
ncbi:MAG: hypothetical protein MZV70_62210 [Desulfobacterales bacterium]|nr:hypothetical protein [Desulfobacterales bacterium]